MLTLKFCTLKHTTCLKYYYIIWLEYFCMLSLKPFKLSHDFLKISISQIWSSGESIKENTC